MAENEAQMANFWLKLKIWIKVLAIAVVVVYLTVFTVSNSENDATVWLFFGEGRSNVTTSVLKLVLIAFICGVIVTILVRTTFRTISQIRDLKQRQATEKRERELEVLKDKASMLKMKERKSEVQ